MSRFVSHKEAAWNRFKSQATEEQFEAMWNKEGEQLMKLLSGYPALDENKSYSSEELSKLHWIDQERYKMAGSPTQEIAQLEVSDTKLAMKPKEFIRRLRAGELVKVPSGLNIMSIRSAAYNAQMRIRTARKDKDWYVILLNDSEIL